MYAKLALLSLFGSVLCADYKWVAPTSTDRRGPCPMVNTLANHGFLPRNGLGISMNDLIIAFNASVNLATPATQLVGAQALLLSTTGNSSTFNIDDLNKHGGIEHDGSLSRADTFFGDNHSFNSTIWNTVAARFTEKTISVRTAALARSARIKAASAVNPRFNMTADNARFSFIETALYLSVFANASADNSAVTKWVKVLFEEERIPYAEGFKRPGGQVTADGLLSLVSKIQAAS